MTDDFHLFADPGDGQEPIDPDLALVSAYLARELSPMQVLALEERLATDATFRAAVQPLIDAWAAPVPSLAGDARPAGEVTALEKAAAWRRFEEESALAAHTAGAAPISRETTVTARRMSMKRIAAVVGIAALPMVSFAQVVSYAAKNADAPGHAIAAQIVASFSSPTKATRAPRGSDAPVGRELTSSDANVLVAAATVAESLPTRQDPDRKRIAELAREKQPAVVRGDTTVDYIVMVLDAADKYVWSTFGNGGVSIEVGGDPRKPSERDAYERKFANELRSGFWSTSYVSRLDPLKPATLHILAVDRGTDSTVPWLRKSADSGRYMRIFFDTVRQRNVVRDSGWARFDTGYYVRLRADSGSERRQIVRADLVGGRGGRGAGGGGAAAVTDTSLRHLVAIPKDDYTVAGGGARGRGAGVDSTKDKPGVYTNSFAAPRLRRGGIGGTNQGYGMHDPIAGQSGIQGLLSSAVAGADLYTFLPGELAPGNLRVMVVHLAPGATWKGKL